MRTAFQSPGRIVPASIGPSTQARREAKGAGESAAANEALHRIFPSRLYGVDDGAGQVVILAKTMPTTMSPATSAEITPGVVPPNDSVPPRASDSRIDLDPLQA